MTFAHTPSSRTNRVRRTGALTSIGRVGIVATCVAAGLLTTIPGCGADDSDSRGDGASSAAESASSSGARGPVAGGGATGGSGSSAQLAAVGQRLYAQHCLICHQADGGGVPWMQPPLAGAASVTGPAEPLIELTLRGIGPGVGQMPPSGDWSQVMASFDALSDQDIAAILTHVRTSWGNDAGAVDATTVTEVRRSIAAGAPAP